MNRNSPISPTLRVTLNARAARLLGFGAMLAALQCPRRLRRRRRADHRQPAVDSADQQRERLHRTAAGQRRRAGVQGQSVAEHHPVQPLRRLSPRRRTVTHVRALGRREPRLPGGLAAGESDPALAVDPGAEGRRRPQLLGRRPFRVRRHHAGVDPDLGRCGLRLHDQHDARSPRRCRQPAAASSSRPMPCRATRASRTASIPCCRRSASAATPRAPPPRSSRISPAADVNEAYAAAQPKINLQTPNQSRFYVRLANEFHHCWVTPSSGGAPDCPGSSTKMLARSPPSPTASR